MKITNKMMKLWMRTLVLITIPFSTSVALAEQCSMDFEGLEIGAVVTELSAGAGINGCTTPKVVPVTSQNCFFSNEAAIIFDSSCTPNDISVCETYDTDIGTPHSDFGGPGRGEGGASGSPYQNDTALYNILVLAKDKIDIFNNTTFANGSDGLVDDPDDADCDGYVAFDGFKTAKIGKGHGGST